MPRKTLKIKAAADAKKAASMRPGLECPGRQPLFGAILVKPCGGGLRLVHHTSLPQATASTVCFLLHGNIFYYVKEL